MFNNKYSQENGGKAINIAHLIACRQLIGAELLSAMTELVQQYITVRTVNK